jgi:hypothetical protein
MSAVSFYEFIIYFTVRQNNDLSLDEANICEHTSILHDDIGKCSYTNMDSITSLLQPEWEHG